MSHTLPCVTYHLSRKTSFSYGMLPLSDVISRSLVALMNCIATCSATCLQRHSNMLQPNPFLPKTLRTKSRKKALSTRSAHSERNAGSGAKHTSRGGATRRSLTMTAPIAPIFLVISTIINSLRVFLPFAFEKAWLVGMCVCTLRAMQFRRLGFIQLTGLDGLRNTSRVRGSPLCSLKS